MNTDKMIRSGEKVLKIFEEEGLDIDEIRWTLYNLIDVVHTVKVKEIYEMLKE